MKTKALSLIQNGKKNVDRDKNIGLRSNMLVVSCTITMALHVISSPLHMEI